MTAQPKRAKPQRSIIYFRVAKVINPETGELVGALLPLTQWDSRAMRERKYHVGTQLRADLKKPRNIKFWGLAHRLGAFLADNVEGFEGLTQHGALKRLQEESNIGCIAETFDLGSLGKVTRTVAESLNFDDMDEGRWAELWDGGSGEGGWIGWLRANKFGQLDPSAREAVELLICKQEH
jgi:hypothetical protein